MSDDIDISQTISTREKKSLQGKCSYCGMWSQTVGKCPFCGKGEIR